MGLKTDRLNGKISFLTMFTLIDALLTRALSFAGFNEIRAGFIGSCAIWILLLVRLDTITKISVYRDWLAIISMRKAILKKQRLN